MKLTHLRNSKTLRPEARESTCGRDNGTRQDPNGCTEGPKCPNIFLTDRGTFIVQGWVITDTDTLADLDIPPGESAVEIPLDLLPELTKEPVTYASR